MSKLLKLKHILSNNVFMLGFLIKGAPLYIILTLLLYIAKGLLQSLSNVWLVEKVIDYASYDLGFSYFIYPVMYFGIYALFVGIFNSLFVEIFEKKCHVKFSDFMRLQLYNKAINCDIACYDDVNFYDNFVWTAKEIDNRAFSVFQSLMMLIQRITVITSTIVLLSNINYIVILLILFSSIISFILTLKQKKIQYTLKEKTDHISQRKNYVKRVFTLPEYAKEMRSSNISNLMFKNFNYACDESEKEIKKSAKILWKINFFKKLLGEDIIVTFFCIALLSYQVILGDITTGGLVASFNGAMIIYSSFMFFLNKISYFVDSSMYIDKFKEFWFYRSKIKDADDAILVKETRSIQFDDVSFFYNDNEGILNNISFCINKPQKIAIVGANGAGKSTLIKILLRLYEPTNGKILHNNQDIRTLELNSYRRRFSCLFQDFNLYAGTLSDNIAMSDFKDDKKILDAIKSSGFADKYYEMSNGLETLITREFDNEGVMFSGGEKQRLAVARVLYKDADCCILDEPTAALDPVAENEFNNKIIKYSKNKLLIIISHRLTTTRFVDKIIVLDNGEIKEIGSHSELILKKGIYSSLYSLQSEQYSKLNL